MREEAKKLYAQLLSDPACKMKPEWVEDAIMEWMHSNMHIFLEENQSMLHKVAGCDEHLVAVSKFVKIDDENVPLIKRIIKNCSAYMLDGLFRRLIESGMEGLIELAASQPNNGHDWLEQYVDKLSPETLASILHRIRWHMAAATSDDIVAACMRRLSADQIMDVIGPHSVDGVPTSIVDWRRPPTKTISVLLQKLPMELAEKLAQYCASKMEEHTCMKCSTHFLSPQGLTLHRKKCDPSNEYPTVKELMAKRRSSERAIA